MKFLETFFWIEHFKEEKYRVYFWLMYSFALSFYFYLSLDGLPKFLPVNCSLDNVFCKLFSDYYLMNAFQDVVVKNYFFIIPFALLAFTGFSFIKEKYLQSLIAFSVFWITYYLPFFLSLISNHEFLNFPNYLILFLVFIFLFLGKARLVALQVFMALFFVYSAPAKFFSETWLLGQFTILPIIPNSFQIFFTNTLILIQIIFPLFLLSNNKRIRYFSVFVFEVFHFYTILLVKLKFAIVCMPILYFAYVYAYEKFDFSEIRKSLLALLFIAFVSFLNLVRFVIPGNDYLTFEGSMYAFSMFQGEYKCDVLIDASPRGVEKFQKTWHECDPKRLVEENRYLCNQGETKVLVSEELIWQHKMVEILNNVDICKVNYKLFSKNDFIKPMVISENVDALSFMQKIVYESINFLGFSYMFVFFASLSVLLYKIFKQ